MFRRVRHFSLSWAFKSSAKIQSGDKSLCVRDEAMLKVRNCSSRVRIEIELWMTIRMTPKDSTTVRPLFFKSLPFRASQRNWWSVVLSTTEYSVFSVGSMTRDKTEKIRSYTHIYITWIFQSYGRTPWHSFVQSSRNHNSAVLVRNADPVGCEIAKSNVWTV
jgi:hypothetical protein